MAAAAAVAAAIIFNNLQAPIRRHAAKRAKSSECNGIRGMGDGGKIFKAKPLPSARFAKFRQTTICTVCNVVESKRT